MGNRVTQTIYTCECCGRTPNNGEHLWDMSGNGHDGYICRTCFDDGSYDEFLEKIEDEKEDNENDKLNTKGI